MTKFLNKHWRLILVVMVVLGGCNNSVTQLAYEAEYNWDKPARRTPDLGIQVTLPSWVVYADQDNVLKVIDSYARCIITKYPSAGQFWWGDLRVYIHECVTEKIVCYYPAIWCSGWQMGKRVYFPMCPQTGPDYSSIVVRQTNAFDVFPHEIFHIIRGWELGLVSVGNDAFTAEMNEADAYAQANCLKLVLSQDSINGALKKLPYKPWLIPGE